MTQYLEAMGTVQSLMDDALTDIQIAYRDGGSKITLPKVDMDGNKVLNDDGTQVYFEQDAHGYLNTYKEYMKAVAKYLGRNAWGDPVDVSGYVTVE